MSEIESSNSPYPELDEEALIALTYLDWRVSSQSGKSDHQVEIAQHGRGKIVGILGHTIMRRIIDYGPPPEDITTMMRIRGLSVKPLCYTDDEWVAFIAGCKANEFDPSTLTADEAES